MRYVDILDYRNCFALNTAARAGVDCNTCRTQLLARCELTNQETGQTGEFFLGKNCIGEHMYKNGGIVQVPTAEVCLIFCKDDWMLAKKFADHDADLIQVGNDENNPPDFDGQSSYWSDFQLHLPCITARPLPSPDDIITATLAFEPLVGRTTISDTSDRWKAVLEYPVVYMNVHPPIKGFTLDVGPVLFPNFDSASIPLIRRMELAYILYKNLDHAEFAVRVPTQIVPSSPTQTMHYSKVMHMDAQNELFSLSAVSGNHTR